MVVEKNIIRTIALSGNFTLDTLISSWDNILKKENIMFEFSVSPLESNVERDIKLAAIIERLLQEARCYTVEADSKKWIKLSVRKRISNIIIKVEFSKKENKIKDTSGIKIIKRIIDAWDGALNLNDKGDEADIVILLS